MNSFAAYAGHLVAAGVLLAFVVYPFSRKYDYYVVQQSARTIGLAGLVLRYLYCTFIAWICTGPLAYAAVERWQPESPLKTRVAWSVLIGFLAMVVVAFLMGTNLLFPDRAHRPGPVRWMDPFLAEFQFIAFIGYGVLLAVISVGTQYLLRKQ